MGGRRVASVAAAGSANRRGENGRASGACVRGGAGAGSSVGHPAAEAGPTGAKAPQAPAPQQAQAPAPEQAQAPIVVPLPRVRTVEAAAEAMSTELAAALDAWLVSAYKRCWKARTAPPDSEPYFPKIRVAFKTDGTLAAPPRLVNPPSDPAWKPQADAALRAVKACDPLHVPDKYAPYYRQWKTKTVYFDPARS